MATILETLKNHNPCPGGRDYLGDQTDPVAAWDNCQRPDWMLWAAGKLGVDRRLIVRAAAMCARTALKYVPIGENRPLAAIEAAERWAENPTEENRVGANAAAYAAYAAAAAAYANANANAADAADAAAYAVYVAADAANVAADAAYAQQGDIRRELAILVREIIPAELIAEKYSVIKVE
jgi:hypothetical protein